MKILKLLVAFLAVVTVFTGCEDDVITNYAFQDISAPQNLTADFDIAQDDSGMLIITPAGEGASTFTIYYGAEGSEPETINAGETASYTYAEGEYLVRIVATGSTGLTSEYSQLVTISFRAPENLVLTVDQSAANPSNVVVSAEADFVTLFDVYFGDETTEDPVQFMPGESVSHEYEELGDYTIRIIAKGAGVATTETTEVITVYEVTSPLEGAPNPIEKAASVISLFSGVYSDIEMRTWRTDWSQASLTDIDIDGNATKQYDELSFVGVEPVSPIDASSMTHFNIDVWTGTATQLRIKLVDFGSDGGFDGGDDSEHEVTLNLDNGDFEQGSWVSLDLPLSAFTGLNGREHIAQLIYSAGPAGAATVYVDNVYFYDENYMSLTTPDTAATVPSADAGSVFSVFSDSYTNPAGVNYYPNWGQSTSYEQIDLSGNAAIKYGNANYQGIDIGEEVDASAYSFVHIDVWSADYTTIPFFIIDTSGERSITLEVKPEQWTSIDIPLSAFTDQGISINNIFQFKFDVQHNTGGAFYIDNLYFHN
ncbi:hypothetical protein [Leeuwenhoekiella marinoflava]|uniref:hypothetical protein n=1 Tax=Leeuwenhoekiella marinoflava TaxID=988 RepID=UPI00300230DA